LTHRKKLVVDLSNLSAKDSISLSERFALALATALAQSASANGYQLYILLKVCEQSSNLWIRDHFADLLAKQQILYWSVPKGLESVCEASDLTLRSVSEHIREAVLSQVDPDLVIVTDLWCGWQDQSAASVGLMGDRMPTAVCLPPPEVLQYGEQGGQSQTCQVWYQKKVLQLKRAHFWLSIEGLSDLSCEQRFSLPPAKVYSLNPATTDFYAEAVATLSTLAGQGRQVKIVAHLPNQRRPRLAYVSPLPPEHTGIASYSLELLPELAKYYDVDVIVGLDEIDSTWVNANAGVYSVAWFTKHGHRYDRVLYQIGNSPFHAHMWDLLERFPGVIVLHDIFLGDATYYRSEHGTGPLLGLPMRLYADHGYGALATYAYSKDIQAAIQNYPYSLCLIQAAMGVIVHSEHAKTLAGQRYNAQLAERFSVIPHLRVFPQITEKQAARAALAIEQDIFLVCSFGHIVSNKMYAELIEAWLDSPLAVNKDCLLVLVGASNGEYGAKLVKQISESGLNDRIRITGWADDANFKAYLSAADLAVQLRQESRGESSGSVLDCMALGLPTICNSHGSMAELPPEGVWRLKDNFKNSELIEALTILWREPTKRQNLGHAARQAVQQAFAPWHCAELYRESIEAFYAQPTQSRSHLIRSLADRLPKLPELTAVSEALEQSLPNIRADRQLLVDITALAHTDLHTGIQRVARSVLKCLLESPPQGYRVEPVYTAFGAQGYFYARQFTKKFLQIDIDILADDPVLMLSEDIFLGLDLCLSDVYEQRHWFEQAQQRGAAVYVVTYDLLPATHPHWFPPSEQPIFEKWLETIKEFDGAISISHATSDALKGWMKGSPRSRDQPFRFGVAHIGADIEASVPTRGLPLDANQVLQKLKGSVTFLMVGTVEPRKGHAQALEAFELLWQEGHDCQLVIVGKSGWNVEQLVSKLINHKELGLRLFWLQGISDEYLSLIYESASCLLAASEAEGFGLPLIEAAKYGLPILARDIVVFKEIGQSNVSYFSADCGQDLKLEIEIWLESLAKGSQITSRELCISTWEQCSIKIKNFFKNRMDIDIPTPQNIINK
jgi:glycosyltransferase involved in cell wall biosynthesis